MEKRQVSRSYRDPLSEVWIAAAYKMGLRIHRSPDAFAHFDGKGNLYIATDEHLDADDCLAQMIFHEFCHSLVEGPDCFSTPDWGLDNTTEADDYREHATLRVQALLAGRFGLREILAPTTDFRQFYDSLELDPLLPRTEKSTQMAIAAVRRSQSNPWWPHLGKALEATRKIVEIAAQWPAPASAPSLYRSLAPPLIAHESGLPGRHLKLEGRCGECAWRDESGYCQQAETTLAPELQGCERFETNIDCLDCGACCRAAYHSVTIAEGDDVADKHPELMVVHDNYTEVRREGDHCAALTIDGDKVYCRIYEDRPTCCREFQNSGQNCVIARRRLGFSL